MKSKLKVASVLLLGSLAFGSLIIAFAFLNPTPPRSVVMSTGPDGSAYAELASRYKDYLSQNGITLELKKSEGARQNIDRLNDLNGDVDIGFVTMGTPDVAASANVRSLGTMFFEPLWVFVSDPVLASGDLSVIENKTISIGPPGSRTNSASRSLFSLLGFDPNELNLVTLEPDEAAEQLTDGVIDVALMVTNSATPLVKRLLANPAVSLVNFRRASAYSALFPELTKLIVPEGVGDLARGLPPEDVNILAFTALLAVREDLHPAIQMLLLDAATQIHSTPDMFHADGRFPASKVFAIPLSQSASRYYTSGRPFLQRFLPFWLAVFVMQVLVAALPLVGVVYPALKLLPSVFEWTMRRRIFRLYGELRKIESRISKDCAADDCAKISASLEELDRRVRNLKVPVTFSNMVFALRSHVNVVRTRHLANMNAA